GNLKTLTQRGSDGLQRTTTYSYTADNRVSDVIPPDGVVTHYDYTAGGQVDRVTVGSGTPLARTTTFDYDAIGRVVATTTGYGTALARTDRTEYNADDTVQRTIHTYQDGVYDPAAPDTDSITGYGYDKLGRLVAVTDVLGRKDVTHYTAQDQVDW